MKYLKAALLDIATSGLELIDAICLLFMPWRWNNQEQKKLTIFATWASDLRLKRIKGIFNKM